MTRSEAQAEHYEREVRKARDRMASALLNRWAFTHPDADEVAIAAAETAAQQMSDEASVCDLHDYGFPWELCETCAAEHGTQRSLRAGRV